MADTSDNLGPGLRAAASTFFAIAVVTLLARCYVRLKIAKAFGVDDWFMVISTVTRTHSMEAIVCMLNRVRYSMLSTRRLAWLVSHMGQGSITGTCRLQTCLLLQWCVHTSRVPFLAITNSQ